MKEKEYVCKKCDGSGYVVDRTAMVFLPVIGWFFAAIENDPKTSALHNRCPRCKGTGRTKLIQ